jgi:hypothetical protein
MEEREATDYGFLAAIKVLEPDPALLDITGQIAVRQLHTLRHTRSPTGVEQQRGILPAGLVMVLQRRIILYKIHKFMNIRRSRRLQVHAFLHKWE